MTAKEAMRIIEQRHLTMPEAYEVVHALFEAERREADDMADYGQQLQGEADELISEYAALREGAKKGT